MIDPSGNNEEFPPTDDKQYIQPYIAKLNDKIKKINSQMECVTAGSKQYNDLEIQRNELQNALTEVNKLSEDKNNLYDIDYVRKDYNNVANTISLDAGGNFTYGGQNEKGQNILKINILGIDAEQFGTLSHELKHAFQFYEGRLGFFVDEMGILFYPYTSNNQEFEREACFRESVYNGFYKSGETIGNYKLPSLYKSLRIEEFSIDENNHYAEKRRGRYVTNR
jgi:hypothetical protein